jgi:hypothetical protein
MHLPDVGLELVCKLGHEWRLEGSRRDDDLVGGDRSPVELEYESAIVLSEPAHVAAELDRKLEGLRVTLEVRDHLVARWIAVRVTWERKARQRAVAARREER